jgi:23S rRNA (cytosine1962-C5)-methyltransferase
MTGNDLETLLDRALQARQALFDPPHAGAFRLFNGFLEGCPDLAVDLYAATAVLYNYADPPEGGAVPVRAAQEFLVERFPWIKAIVLKTRSGASAEARRGSVIFGSGIDRKVCEHGVWYAVDLCMHRDASLYLDTRNLRLWAIQNLKNKTVLNTFAYTGSLGAAALAGGARRVVQLDRDRRFLDLAKRTYTLNGFPAGKQDFLAGDFFPQVSRLKRAGEHFDCVLLDPPFFSTTEKGVVDLAENSARLINKVRPLVDDGGHLVAVNNALFVSGKEYIETLEALCVDGYLEIEEFLPVPEDFTGYPGTRRGSPVTDPAPFNHSTKIAVLKVRRKTG